MKYLTTIVNYAYTNINTNTKNKNATYYRVRNNSMRLCTINKIIVVRAGG